MKQTIALIIFLALANCSKDNPVSFDGTKDLGKNTLHYITVANHNSIKTIVCAFKVDTVNYTNNDTLYYDTLIDQEVTDTIKMESHTLYRVLAASFCRSLNGGSFCTFTEIPVRFNNHDSLYINFSYQGDSLSPVIYHP